MCLRRAFMLLAVLFLVAPAGANAEEPAFQFGFSKLDITPSQPLRLSGYGNRTKPSEGIDEKLHVRAMAVRTPDGQTSVLTSVDTIGFPGVLTTSIARQVEEQFGVPRRRFVLCSTHSHTAPHIGMGLMNLFAKPMTKEESTRSKHYVDRAARQVVKAVGAAIADLAPGKLYYALGKATFADNRRVLKDGIWTGFGVNPNGPVDHSLPILRIVGDDGATRGVVFNYACHCTTFGGGYNRVNGDWAGYAAKYLEQESPGAVALCTIGCGADANPKRDSKRAFELAQSQGREIAVEAQRLMAGEMQPITAKLTTSFGYAGLPSDRPTVAQLKKRLNDKNIQTRRHAATMLATLQRMGRLPETYPAPVQVWRFGDQLSMVFLGGEVVVDYAFRLKRDIKTERVWVTAYANDVFGYVASERVRKEGGYEVDFSMIFYNLPGPWSAGTEEVLVRRVLELHDTTAVAGPFSPEESLKRFHLTDGFKIGIVASEPLISDPVSFTVGADGRLWVAEMGDYPRGENDSGAPGGRIKVLTDTDHDGRYDQASTFLEGLSYPNGVFPWRGGVIVSAAPEIFYAEDTNADGHADVRRPLFTGFVEANPQHRANGFAYGLDNWLYLAGGAANGEVTSVKTGKKIAVGRRDFRIQPEEGLLESLSGHTQHSRHRDDWGNWFGSDNSHPIFHYVISDRYLRRNPFVASPAPQVHLLQPALAPAVFPTSRTLDRFNDLFAANRFTSACGGVVFRDITLGDDMHGAALVCEPVHNLVHRAMVQPNGLTFSGSRHASEQHSEFLSSTDNWFRPDNLATGADGALWVSDMYRHVIEHPQWIPEAWQTQLNLRAGDDRGRIYRVYRNGHPPQGVPNLASMSSAELVEQLQSDNGWRRDTAQRLLVQRGPGGAAKALANLYKTSSKPTARIHALCTLDGIGELPEELLAAAMSDGKPHLRRRAVLLSEKRLGENPAWLKHLAPLADDADIGVVYQLALSLGESNQAEAADLLSRLLLAHADNPRIRFAVLSSARPHAQHILPAILPQLAAKPELNAMVGPLVSTALGNATKAGAGKILAAIAAEQSGGVRRWQLTGAAAVLTALDRKKLSLADLQTSADADMQAALAATDKLLAFARRQAADPAATLADRIAAIQLLGRGATEQKQDLAQLAELLAPQSPPQLQSAALAAIAAVGQSQTPAILLQAWRSRSPRLQSEILQVLLSRQGWTSALLASLEGGDIDPAGLDAAARQRLLEHPQKEIRQRAEKLLSSPGGEGRRQALQEYNDVLTMAGSQVRGFELFARRCGVCHRYRGVGNDIGAALASLKDKSTAALLTAILDPSQAVEQKYRSYSIAMADGRVLSGMIAAESATSLTLALPNGEKKSLLRVDLEEFASTGKSFMPEGLEKDLSRQDIADVIAFLQSKPLSLAALSPQSISKTRELLNAFHWSGLANIDEAAPTKKLATLVGSRNAAFVSAKQPALRWQTSPVPKTATTADLHVFRLLVAMGAPSETSSAFTLKVNGHALANFAPTLEGAAWANGESSGGIRYLVLATSEKQSQGVLIITAPASWLTPGEAVRMEAVANDAQNKAWFAIIPCE